MDDKLKKGEIKVTVIATGFDDFLLKKSGETRIQDISPINHIEDRTDNKKPRPRPAIKSDTPLVEDSENEWDIPAFIRRKIK